jgi:hypothetical protein
MAAEFSSLPFSFLMKEKMPKHEYLDIARLKTLGKPNYFGLGFIQLKLNAVERLHFYHPDVMPILDQEEIHDHRYDFSSTVIKGALMNTLYTYESVCFAEYGLYEVSCKKDDVGKEPAFLGECMIHRLADFTVETGQTYNLTRDVFHRIEYPVPTITFLRREHIFKENARIIKAIDAPSVCPFSKVMDEDEIWEVIEKIIES